MLRTFGVSGRSKAGRKYAGNPDGLDGPQTRAAIHLTLVDLASKAQVAQAQIKAAPVTEEKPVVVTPPSLDAPRWKSKEVIVPVATGTGLFRAGGDWLDAVAKSCPCASGFRLGRRIPAVAQKSDAKAVSDGAGDGLMWDLIPHWLKIGAATVVGATLLSAGSFQIGKREGKSVTSRGSKAAIARINTLEKNNASFRSLSDRHRCLIFMRDSGLSDSACD